MIYQLVSLLVTLNNLSSYHLLDTFSVPIHKRAYTTYEANYEMTGSSLVGMYRIAIFKIRPEPNSTRYQTNYPAGTGYLDTCCIIANFLVYFVV